MRLRLGLLLLAPLLGCSGDPTTQPPGPDPLPAVEPCDDPLAMRLSDGSCLRPGIPEDGCAEGFAHDGEYGCEPILPSEPCPPGQMAVPGDTSCHAVMDCGQGKWGDIPVDATTQYVDGGYAGGDSDGSEAKPWTTINDAYTAAEDGDLIAVAAGTYQESLDMQFKPVRLWGVCPDEVTIAGPGDFPAVVGLRSGASGSELVGLAITGEGVGVVVQGTSDVLLDRLHVHDTTGRGVNIQDAIGSSSLELTSSLIEGHVGEGLFIFGSPVDVDAVVVRDNRANAEGNGRGISIQAACVDDPSGILCYAQSAVTVSRSLMENNIEAGLRATGSDVSLDASVIRRSLPMPDNGERGVGVFILPPCRGTPSIDSCDTSMRPHMTLRDSVIEQSHQFAVYVLGGDLVTERTVIRDTQTEGVDGRGLQIQAPCYAQGPSGLECYPDAAGTGAINESLIENHYEYGVLASNAQVAVSRSVIRGIKSRAANDLAGDGAVVAQEGEPSRLDIAASLIADSDRASLSTFGAHLGIAESRLTCSTLDINGEQFSGNDFTIEDGGGNRCGCPTADLECVAVSAGLAPPASSSL